MAAPRHVTVVPCFNEARRLQPDRLLELVPGEGWQVLLVDDGSTDDTPRILDALSARHPTSVRVLHLLRNGGKAEAVRRGLLEALGQGAEAVGYFDADLATPPSEMVRLFRVREEKGAQSAMASRVALLGRDIQRKAVRHYLGRLFATAASLALSLRVYDTQCGAKVLRASDVLRQALAEPFTTRWVFDVELMMRLLRGNAAGRLAPSDFVEMPLTAWEDVGGSKLSRRAMTGAALDLARLAVRHRLSD